MEKDNLITSARKLKQPPESAANEFDEKKDIIASKVNQIMSNRPDLEKLIGKDNKMMMEDNHRNFTRFMVSIFYEYNPDVFVDTVLWAIRAYKNHGFHQTYWPAELDTFIEVLRKELSDKTYELIYPFYHWITVNIPIGIKLAEIKIESVEHKSH